MSMGRGVARNRVPPDKSSPVPHPYSMLVSQTKEMIKVTPHFLRQLNTKLMHAAMLTWANYSFLPAFLNDS